MRVLPLQYYLPTVKGLAANLIRRKSVYPFYASFKLTTRCHFGCRFCNIKKDPVKDLPTADIKEILKNLSRSSILMTSFEGGEPLLRQDIAEILSFARSCKFYLLFTTSARNLLSYPMEEYAKFIDFLHVSIDEDHDNLEMFDILPNLASLPCQISVQTVVTRDTIDSLDKKVQICFQKGANIVIIPATHMDKAEDCFPDLGALEKKLLYLRKLYPHTIHTPQGYFKAFRNRKCSSGSVIIAADGHLYYPCHILGRKGPDLRNTDLMSWLTSPEAEEGRQLMNSCNRNCGWYQYYSIDSYTSVSSVVDALLPVLTKKKELCTP